MKVNEQSRVVRYLRAYPRSCRGEIERSCWLGGDGRIVEVNVPIVQPIYDLRHLLDKECAVGVHRIPGEDSISVSRDPLLDVV